jgi:type I restriction enzyme, S subunit
VTDGQRLLSDVADIQGGIQKQPRRAPKSNAYPYLRVANVTANGLDLTVIHKMELFGDELDKLRLKQGDLLVVEGNGSPSQIGRAVVWDGSIDDCVHQNHIIRVRPHELLDPQYLESIWNSPQNRSTLTALSSSSSGLHTLSVGKLKQLSIPVPPLSHQQRIVETLQDHLSRLDVANRSIEIAARRSASLRASLLASAFSGQL